MSSVFVKAVLRLHSRETCGGESLERGAFPVSCEKRLPSVNTEGRCTLYGQKTETGTLPEKFRLSIESKASFFGRDRDLLPAEDTERQHISTCGRKGKQSDACGLASVQRCNQQLGGTPIRSKQTTKPLRRFDLSACVQPLFHRID